MQLGVAVGPSLDQIEQLPDRFEHVEIGLGEGEVSLTAFDPASVVRRTDERGLDLVVHLPYRQPVSTPVDRIDQATLSYFDDLLAAASAAGADRAVAHPNARGGGHETNQFSDRLAALAARGRDHGVEVCFETTGYAGGPNLSRLGDLIDHADVSVCLDVGYAYLEGGEDGVESFLATHGDRVAHLHVHDARHRGDTHIPLGSGDVPIADLTPLLDAHVRDDATASLEVFTDDTDLLVDSARRFERALDDG
jgi:sugar phosphate isomerase/epimerase